MAAQLSCQKLQGAALRTEAKRVKVLRMRNLWRQSCKELWIV